MTTLRKALPTIAFWLLVAVLAYRDHQRQPIQSVFAQANNTLYDTLYSQTLTAAVAGTSVQNSFTGGQSMSRTFAVEYYTDGFSGLSLQFEIADQKADGTAGTWTLVTTACSGSNPAPPCVLDGTSPSTTTGYATFSILAFAPYLRINVTSVTGSGHINYRIYGYKGLSARNRSGGVGASGASGASGVGATGATGASGVGIPGPTGASGVGTPGATGATGPSGAAGGSGAAGSVITNTTFAARGTCTTNGNVVLFNNSWYESAFCDGSAFHYLLNGFEMKPPDIVATFSTVNLGGASFDSTHGPGVITNATDASFSVKARVTTVPATPYHVIFAFYTTQNNNTNVMSGLLWRDSTSGKLIIWGPFQAGSSIVAFTMTNPTTFGGTTIFNTGPNIPLGAGPYWIRMGDNGTNRTYDYSIDQGLNWINLDSAIDTGFLTADQVGYFLNGCGACGGTVATNITALHWNVTP
jgi:hypothetical protein